MSAPALRIVAEIGTSHEGNIDHARDLVHAARDAGADMAKFQFVLADEILHPRAGNVDIPLGAVPLYERFQELERPAEFYVRLMDLCQEAGIQFLCTPFGLESARILRRLGVQEFKIASPELNHLPLLRTVASMGVAIILSSGVSTVADLAESLDLVRLGGARKITILHCITAYPAPEEEYNLKAIPSMSNLFGVPVGVSDHSLDPVIVPALATLMGATMIEKHITLRKSDHGLDDAIALEPGDFARMVREVRAIAGQLKQGEGDPVELRRRQVVIREELSRRYGDERVRRVLGTGVKHLAPSEQRNYGRTNRSILAVTDLSPGDTITGENAAILRSEKNLSPGLHPRYWEVILGKRILRPVRAGEGISWPDILSR
ncbi:MAG: spore coat protein [Spirochaetaceae bacterium]|nr:MAG: spore coat protein [Spirochaetaceae bacterium]